MAKRQRRHITVYSDDPRFKQKALLKMNFGLVRVAKVSEMHKDIMTKRIRLDILEVTDEKALEAPILCNQKIQG